MKQYQPIFITFKVLVLYVVLADVQGNMFTQYSEYILRPQRTMVHVFMCFSFNPGNIGSFYYLYNLLIGNASNLNHSVYDLYATFCLLICRHIGLLHVLQWLFNSFQQCVKDVSIHSCIHNSSVTTNMTLPFELSYSSWSCIWE